MGLTHGVLDLGALLLGAVLLGVVALMLGVVALRRIVVPHPQPLSRLRERGARRGGRGSGSGGGWDWCVGVDEQLVWVVAWNCAGQPGSPAHACGAAQL